MRKINKANHEKSILRLLWGIALTCILFLSVGFAYYSQRLTIDGKGKVNFNGIMKITNVSVYETSGGGYSKKTSFTNDTATVSASTPNNDSYVVYAIDITNLLPYDAYLNAADPISFELANGNQSTVHSYEYLNLDGATVIPKRSIYTLYVKVYYSNSGSVSSGNDTINAKFKLFYSLNPTYLYTINATPSDSNISLTCNGDTYNVVGTYKIPVEEGKDISWSVTKEDYITKSGTYTMASSNYENNVTIEPIPKYQLRVVPSPSSAYVTITRNGKVLAEGEGTQTVQIVAGAEISYSVVEVGYNDGNGTYTTTASAHDINVTLTEKPWITGTTSNTNRTQAATKSDTNYHPGYYLIEVWGGKGGDQYDTSDNGHTGYGGAAGYVYGVVKLNYGDTIYATAGGNGQNAELMTHSAAGANGGGAVGGLYPGAGGGYSAFVINTTTISESTVSSGNVLFIAGGGGGGSSNSTALATRHVGDGGAGGNLSSMAYSVTGGTVYAGADGKIGVGSTVTYGKGGAYDENSNKNNSKAGAEGGFLTGGMGYQKGGGGGAGYFGGGGGAGLGSNEKNNSGGGGGGSSFVASSVSTTLPSGVSTSSNPSSTGGAIKITYIGKNI